MREAQTSIPEPDTAHALAQSAKDRASAFALRERLVTILEGIDTRALRQILGTRGARARPDFTNPRRAWGSKSDLADDADRETQGPFTPRQ
jgi:hypothetical protein